MAIDYDCLLDIDFDKNRVILWFVISTYAKSEKNDELISDDMMRRLQKKLVDNWDDLCHNLKQYIHMDHEGKYVVSEYPKRVDLYYKQMREIYVGKNSKGNDR